MGIAAAPEKTERRRGSHPDVSIAFSVGSPAGGVLNIKTPASAKFTILGPAMDGEPRAMVPARIARIGQKPGKTTTGRRIVAKNPTGQREGNLSAALQSASFTYIFGYGCAFASALAQLGFAVSWRSECDSTFGFCNALALA